jgi:type VI protein secretion system component Hcp
MSNVIVTSVHVAASQDSNAPTESITLSFGKVEFNYKDKAFKFDVTGGKPV